MKNKKLQNKIKPTKKERQPKPSAKSFIKNLSFLNKWLLKFGWRQGDGGPAKQKSNIFQRSHQGFTLMELLVAIGIFSIFLGAITTSYVSIVRGHGETNERRKMLSDVRYLMDFISDELRQGTVDYWTTYCDKTDISKILNGKTTADKPFDQIQKGVTNEFLLSKKTCSTTKLGNGLIPTQNQKKLVIISKDGSKKTTIKFEDGKVKIKEQIQAFDFKKNESLYFNTDFKTYKTKNETFSNFQTLELENTQIDNLSFLISPIDDPYASRNYEYAALQFQPHVTVFLTAGIPNKDPSKPARTPINIQTTISSRLYSQRN